MSQENITSQRIESWLIPKYLYLNLYITVYLLIYAADFYVLRIISFLCQLQQQVIQPLMH